MINEILSSDIDIPGQSDFVVNNAVDQVAVTVPGVSGLDFINGNAATLFEPGDNVLLTGAFVNIPYGFGQGLGKAYIGIAWKTLVNTFVTIPELASNSVLVLPNFCLLEFPPSGLYIVAPRGSGQCSLCLTTIVMTVSQINVPTQINGDTVKVQFHLRVNHTLPLTNLG